VRVLVGTSIVFAIVSIVFSAATASVTGTVLATLFGGTAFVGFLAAAFLAVGQSEDRARAQDAADRAEHLN
jgi:hypothetical protein